MNPRTLPLSILLPTVRSQVAFTYRRLRTHPLTTDLPITATFEQLLQRWPAMQQKELDIEDKVDDCAVVVTSVDGELNQFAQRTSSALLVLTQNKRTHNLYLHFFDGKPLHIFVKPTLASQLEAMAKWIPSLAGSEHASLKALGAELPPLIDKARKATEAKVAAEHERDEFRDIGERAKYIEEVNAARKEAYGALSTLPHKHTGLPSGFADAFFRRDRTKKGEEVTPETLEEDIAELKAELAEKELALAEFKKAEATKVAEETAAREAAAAELAEIRKELAEKQKKAAELQAILEKKP